MAEPIQKAPCAQENAIAGPLLKGLVPCSDSQKRSAKVERPDHRLPQTPPHPATRVPLATMSFRPSITAPGKQLRRVNANPASDRRDARARLQRLRHDLGLKLVRPAIRTARRQDTRCICSICDAKKTGSNIG